MRRDLLKSAHARGSSRSRYGCTASRSPCSTCTPSSDVKSQAGSGATAAPASSRRKAAWFARNFSRPERVRCAALPASGCLEALSIYSRIHGESHEGEAAPASRALSPKLPAEEVDEVTLSPLRRSRCTSVSSTHSSDGEKDEWRCCNEKDGLYGSSSSNARRSFRLERPAVALAPQPEHAALAHIARRSADDEARPTLP